MNPAQHHIIKDAGETIGLLLQAAFKDNGYKRVHLIVGAPKQDAIEGKLPALNVYLFNILIDEEGITGNRGRQYIETEIGPDGKPVELIREGPITVRLEYLISTWAQTPEEEQLLMGAAIKALIENQVISGANLKGNSFAVADYLPITLVQKLDEGVLSRFWASLSQPFKPALQVMTTVLIYPSGGQTFQRVQEKDVRFFDLSKISQRRR